MDANWPQSLVWVRKQEGGNDDDPDDPGGRTSRGITQREYNAYCSLHGLPRLDVWSAPDEQIDDIYLASYWRPYSPALPTGVDYSFFDENVNAGLHEAAVILQRALGVAADGHIGAVTMAACQKADADALVDEIARQRVLVYKQTRGFWKYGKGWLNRVEFCRKNAHTLKEASNVDHN